MRVTHIAGTRANYTKIAPVYQALARHAEVAQVLIAVLLSSTIDFDETDRCFLSLPEPDFSVDGRSDSYFSRITKIAAGVQACIEHTRPDFLLVYGDVDSTLGAAIAGARTGAHIVHVESGLRNELWSDNEEINRIVVDHVAQTLAVSDLEAVDNLVREKIPDERILLAGNTIIDSLISALKQTNGQLPKDLRFPSRYILFTIHKDVNLDSSERMASLLQAVLTLSEHIPIVFPVQSRAKQAVMAGELFQKLRDNPSVFVSPPIPYQQFVVLLRHAECVITDSSTLQDETTYLRIPCLTCLDQTHRASTLTCGTNRLVGTDTDLIISLALSSIEVTHTVKRVPWGWDGRAAERIVEHLLFGGNHG